MRRKKHREMPTPSNNPKKDPKKKRKKKKNHIYMSVQKGEDETTERLNAGHDSMVMYEQSGVKVKSNQMQKKKNGKIGVHSQLLGSPLGEGRLLSLL